MASNQLKPDLDHPNKKRIRSFVKREGRLTSGQQRALRELWSLYGIDYAAELIDELAVFGRIAPLALDIGFGNGESLIAMAEALPDWNFVGIEVHRPGVGGCLLNVEQKDLKNVRVICHDAVEILEHMIKPSGLDRICVFYPDPWHKKRHHKRRLINPPVLMSFYNALKSGGELHMVTDWQDYAEHIELVMADDKRFTFNGNSPNINRPAYRPVTKYERRGLKLGHSIYESLYIKE